MKYMLLIIAIFVASCSVTRQTTPCHNFSLKDEINHEIIDGFFNGDTTSIPKNTYFLK